MNIWRFCSICTGGRFQVILRWHKPGRIFQDHQIDFHYVPADVFAERDFYKTEITDKLAVNGLEHAVLVVPYSQFITRQTVEAVIELAAKGAKCFSSTLTPTASAPAKRCPVA